MPDEIVPILYEKYYGGENARQGVFDALATKFHPKRVLYPGGFIHVAASFVFPSVTYVDTDKNAKKFFANMDQVVSFVSKRKNYSKNPEIAFKGCSYENDLGEEDSSFNMVISLYAGFISQPCKRYLSKGGVLAVNNSHGDAGLASIDKDFKFIGVLKGTVSRCKFSDDRLEEYFIPKKDIKVTEELLRNSGRGVGYTLTAPVYLFEKI